MNDYIERLKRCGESPSEATRIVQDFILKFDESHLEAYIRSREADTYVGAVQP